MLIVVFGYRIHVCLKGEEFQPHETRGHAAMLG